MVRTQSFEMHLNGEVEGSVEILLKNCGETLIMPANTMWTCELVWLLIDSVDGYSGIKANSHINRFVMVNESGTIITSLSSAVGGFSTDSAAHFTNGGSSLIPDIHSFTPREALDVINFGGGVFCFRIVANTSLQNGRIAATFRVVEMEFDQDIELDQTILV